MQNQSPNLAYEAEETRKILDFFFSSIAVLVQAPKFGNKISNVKI